MIVTEKEAKENIAPYVSLSAEVSTNAKRPNVWLGAGRFVLTSGMTGHLSQARGAAGWRGG